jgi:hypothetical protein
MRAFVKAVTAVGSAALICTALSGCSTPTVAKSDLQADIANRLQKTGQKPESVTCGADLEGVVGKSTRCEVVLSQTNAIEPIVTVTKVDGTTVIYEMAPALSQPQLEKAVGDIVAKSIGLQVESVMCESGLEGREGQQAHCQVLAGGITTHDTVTVSKVDGLLMNFDVTAD